MLVLIDSVAMEVGADCSHAALAFSFTMALLSVLLTLGLTHRRQSGLVVGAS